MKNKEQIAKIWDVLDSLNVDVLHNKQAIIKLENEREQPLLKQLDQSVFNGLDEKWRFAAVDKNGSVYKFRFTPKVSGDSYFCDEGYHKYSLVGTGYDTSNSLIERESEELIGSDLCKAMLARGDKFILCGVSDRDDSDAANHEDDDFLAEAVTDFDFEDGLFSTASMYWAYAVPINNQGEPLTAAEAGL